MIFFRPGGTPDISRWWNHRGQWLIAFPAPEGRHTEAGLPPLLGWEDYLSRTPVVPPPANIRSASGAIACEHPMKHASRLTVTSFHFLRRLRRRNSSTARIWAIL